MASHLSPRPGRNTGGTGTDPAAGSRPDLRPGAQRPDVPDPRTLRALERALRAAVREGSVDFSRRRRAEYAQDASNYRQVPAAVVLPAGTGELVAAVAACRELGVAVTLRGAGTSIAGQAVGDGVVIDTSRHLDRILDIDAGSRTARVEPGVILDDLQAACRPYGLRFGPDPSTHARCTIGGMIGNNACGTHSVAWGRTADNVLELDVLTYDGTRMRVRSLDPGQLQDVIDAGGRPGEIHARLRDLRDRNLALLRTELGRFRRQVSGYGLEHLLPERGFDVAAALVGTEGTCVVVLSATVRLVPVPARRTLVVLGFDDLPSAGDAAPAVLGHGPTACEGLGADQVAALRRNVPDAAPERLLPEGRGWLLCEFGTDAAAAGDGGDGSAGGHGEGPEQERALALQRDTAAVGVRLVLDPAEQRALWRVREDSAGLATRAPDGSEAWPGWEDSAVPVENLGEYLRDFEELMARHDLHGTPYGHFGEGCVHIRIDFDHTTDRGVTAFRTFMGEAAALVGRHGGTLSGEHGDGQARAEFLPIVHSPAAMDAFAAFKEIWDPGNRLNPGILVRPRPADERLRIQPGHRPALPLATSLALEQDGGDLDRALRRCVGVAKCRTGSGGVMCPSYRATGDEKDSTRGRARVLYEMVQGEVVTGGWRSREALEVLDLCLSCKGCKSDCPVGVDMATYKAEFLHQHYRRRLRPLSHYSLGWLPQWSRWAARAPRLVNALTRGRFGSAVLKAAGGIAPGRPIPPFARQRFRTWFDGRPARAGAASPDRRVLLWADTFTEYFTPDVGQAAVEVLEHAGFEVLLPPDRLCCGLTWLTTGQLGTARRVLGRTLDAVDPYLAQGIPLVGLEPSCTSLFRADAVELFGDDPRARRAAGATVTLAELLDQRAPDADLGRLDRAALTQTHCHQHATLGSAADDRVLARAGIGNVRLDSGCCGLAGNFGFERAHYDVSVQVAEHAMLPALRKAPEDTVVLADGFSCRTQISHLSQRRPVHLAQVLRDSIRSAAAGGDMAAGTAGTGTAGAGPAEGTAAGAADDGS